MDIVGTSKNVWVGGMGSKRSFQELLDHTAEYEVKDNTCLALFWDSLVAFSMFFRLDLFLISFFRFSGRPRFATGGYAWVLTPSLEDGQKVLELPSNMSGYNLEKNVECERCHQAPTAHATATDAAEANHCI